MIGCGLFDGVVDCFCNIYIVGCYLLCYDDVIGIWRILYIIYFFELDEVWMGIDGG